MNTVFIASILLILSYELDAAPNASDEDAGNQYENDLIEQEVIQNSKKVLLYPKPVDCAEIFENGFVKSGVYDIFPKNRDIGCSSFIVYCDMETDGGGWTVIQRRGDFKRPIDYFYKTWKEYKKGFGSFKKDFWLGNDYIHALTNQKKYAVRFDLSTDDETAYALYDDFWIANEDFKYRLHITDYSGTAGDAMSYHHNMEFSTKDRKNDRNTKSCADMWKGGWWYKDCYFANLNGLDRRGANEKDVKNGTIWSTWKGYSVSLTNVEIKVRPNSF